MTQLRGILVANGYLRTEKFEEITGMYQGAARKYDVKLDVYYTHDLVCGVRGGNVYHNKIGELGDVDFVLFLDKGIYLARAFEMSGVRVFNPSHVIAACDDKAETFQRLSGHRIPMPHTIIAPLIYEGTYKEVDESVVKEIGETLGYPLVVKESFGSFGEQVYLIHNLEELVEKHRELAYKPHIYQEFIKSSFGKDVRINVVGDKVVASMLRTSDKDFRANITNGGSMSQWDCPLEYEALAVEVCKVLGADFAGVDLLFGENGEPIVCEVNSNAHIKNIMMCTGVNVAEEIIRYIKQECSNA